MHRLAAHRAGGAALQPLVKALRRKNEMDTKGQDAMSACWAPAHFIARCRLPAAAHVSHGKAELQQQSASTTRERELPPSRGAS